ncbi:MAG TPA: hypothetical protein VM369_07850 [Candidatus Binatia bacterium]|nr:hypothetical protein [Candidatus Binatia bacterium]
MGRTFTVVAGAALLLAACGAPEPPKEKPKAGREETREIRNLQAIGVNGAAVADKVDEAIKLNEDRQKQLDAEAAKSE